MLTQHNCGTCKRGAESTKNTTCQKCWNDEIKGGERFGQWEAKK